MVKKITLTEDHIKLIRSIKFEKIQIKDKSIKNIFEYGINSHSLFGGNFVLEDIAFILNRYDERVAGSEENPMGPRFPEETETYFYSLYDDIVDNLEYIVDLIFFYCDRGGITAGTYKCIDTEKDWTKIK